jgi:hypothetical protein
MLDYQWFWRLVSFELIGMGMCSQFRTELTQNRPSTTPATTVMPRFPYPATMQLRWVAAQRNQYLALVAGLWRREDIEPLRYVPIVIGRVRCVESNQLVQHRLTNNGADSCLMRSVDTGFLGQCQARGEQQRYYVRPKSSG